jgi:hypothetical protein
MLTVESMSGQINTKEKNEGLEAWLMCKVLT